MKTEQHIAQLLYRYQCVTVPGFGAFLTETQPAQLHEHSNSFYPPKKLVSFNAYLKNNDGLLANHIAQAEKTSYENAVEIIREEVSVWKNSIYTNGRFTLKNIGELSLNSEKSLVFTPAGQTNYLTDSFGLSSFVSPNVKREAYKQEVEILEEKAPILFTPEKRTTPYLKYAAIFVLALTAGGSIGFKIFQNQVAEQTLVVETEVQKQVQDKIQEATFFIQNPLPSVKLAVKEEKRSYHIVAGVFRSEENAQKACDELKAEGYQSRRIAPNRHGLFPVLFGSYATYEDANKAMLDIRQAKDPNAWMMIKDL